MPGEIRVHHGPAAPSRLELPVLPDTAEGPGPPAFRTAAAGLREVGGGEEDPPEWRIEEDVLGGTVTVTISEGGSALAEDGSSLYSGERIVLTARDHDPGHATLASDVVYRWRVDGHAIDIRATGVIDSDAGTFDVRVALDVHLDDAPFFAREWHEAIPRSLV
jgi:hypothetical protein